MFPELTNAFAPLQSSSNHTIPSGSFLLVSDSAKADGSFILQHVLHTYLKANKGVCLVGIEQSLFHYCSIGRKLGVNLESDQFKSKFAFINGLSTPYKHFLSSSRQSDSANYSFDETKPFSLVEKIKQTVELIGEEGCTIIIDNLNLLANLFGETAVTEIIHHLKLLCEDQQNDSCVICLIHDNNAASKIATFGHLAEAIIAVEDFETGYSKEIHGQLTVIYNKLFIKDQSKYPTSFRYKVLENSVKLFP